MNLNIKSKQYTSSKIIFGILASAIGVGIGNLLVKDNRATGINLIETSLEVGVLYVVGLQIGTYYSKRQTKVTKLGRFIYWSNIITWVLPGIGVLTSGFTIGSLINKRYSSQKYRTLGYVGAYLSVINAVLAAIIFKYI